MNNSSVLSKSLSKTGFLVSQFFKYFVYSDEYAVDGVQACQKAIDQQDFDSFLANIDIANPYEKKERCLQYLVSARIKRGEEDKYQKLENKLLKLLTAKYHFKPKSYTYALLAICAEMGDTKAFEYFLASPKYDQNNIDFSSLLFFAAKNKSKEIFDILLEIQLHSPNPIVAFTFESSAPEHKYYFDSYSIVKSKKELEKSLASNKSNRAAENKKFKI